VRGGLWAALAVAAATAAATLAVVADGYRAQSPPDDVFGDRRAQARPMAPGAGFLVPAPVALDERPEYLSYWATVLRPVAARATPRLGARVVARVGVRTPEETSNIVLVVGRAKSGGRLWVRVRLAVLPNGSTGWVPRDALGSYGVVRTRLVVDRERFTATLLRDGREVFRARVGVGQPRWPTPPGEFYVRNKLVSYRSPVYGPLAFGTSARSSVLTDWPAGGFIAIHGTNEPELLPGAVSHGCIRLRNEDILVLSSLMPVGTPVTIR
jgi:L,D-transpeptidase catalytic domain